MKGPGQRHRFAEIAKAQRIPVLGVESSILWVFPIYAVYGLSKALSPLASLYSRSVIFIR
jgi:hypothetical protein